MGYKPLSQQNLCAWAFFHSYHCVTVLLVFIRAVKRKSKANDSKAVSLYEAAKNLHPLPDFFIAGRVAYPEMRIFFAEYVARYNEHIKPPRRVP
jgi:hypothetical protein